MFTEQPCAVSSASGFNPLTPRNLRSPDSGTVSGVISTGRKWGNKVFTW